MTRETDSVIVLFDGVCNLCNSAVQFLIRRDKKRVFRYASLQSDFAIDLLTQLGEDASQRESVLVYGEGRLFKRSDAALYLASKLGGFWKVALMIKILPRFIRDGAYNLVARNRYRWFGKRNECMIPKPDDQDLFL